jgi:hypothetical protein
LNDDDERDAQASDAADERAARATLKQTLATARQQPGLLVPTLPLAGVDPKYVLLLWWWWWWLCC